MGLTNEQRDMVIKYMKSPKCQLDKDYILRRIIGLTETDLRSMKEQIGHERIINQRILKLNRIINEIDKK